MNAADMKCLFEIYEGVNLLNAKIDSLIRSNERLTSGPGGIMEMKQTIADKEAEIERLRKALREIIASDWKNGVCADIARAALDEDKPL